jgi:small-conductance mechanosensitive channel
MKNLEIDFNNIINFVLIKTDRFTISVASILVMLGILLVTIVVIKTLGFIIKKYAKRKNVEEGSAHSVYLIAKYFLWVIAIVLMLEATGMNISILLASAAALLVGIGLGLQQLFNDVASGIVILIEQNVKILDVVEVESQQGTTVGVVIKTGIRTSKIKTRDNIIIDIPNSLLVNNKMINWSQMEKTTRFHVNIGVAYGSDIHLVKEVLLGCAKDKKEILNNPQPFVRFIDFGNSSLDFQLYFWTNNSFGVEHIKSELRFAIYDALEKNNIRIPFPQRDVHLYKEVEA